MAPLRLEKNGKNVEVYWDKRKFKNKIDNFGKKNMSVKTEIQYINQPLGYEKFLNHIKFSVPAIMVWYKCTL